jgi:hypothetical protein
VRTARRTWYPTGQQRLTRRFPSNGVPAEVGDDEGANGPGGRQATLPARKLKRSRVRLQSQQSTRSRPQRENGRDAGVDVAGVANAERKAPQRQPKPRLLLNPNPNLNLNPTKRSKTNSRKPTISSRRAMRMPTKAKLRGNPATVRFPVGMRPWAW